MKNVLAYVTRTEKTQSEDKQYVTALNCNTATAYEEMLATKNTYHKNSGRMYYHLVQSFPKGDDSSPELAHLIVDEPAAEIVRRIFRLTAEGIGYNKIAKIFRAEKVLNPIAYFNQHNPDYFKSDYWRKEFDWTSHRSG